MRLRVLSILIVLPFLTAISTTTLAAVHTSATPKPRVTTKVDNTKRATLVGHVPHAVRRALDLGQLDHGISADHVVMVLKSDDDQKRELRRILDEQQDQHTANFHQWVTPEEFGGHFGVHDSDIAQVKAWLISQGLTVDEVSKSKRILRFSGNLGQIEKAFGTEMHEYQVDGQMHVSNNSEISVPAALSSVIAGVSLHNFFRPGHMGEVSRIKLGPHYTSSSTTHYLGPVDFATIYNTAPLLAAGINGTGQTIAVVGRSDILLSDVQTYRQMFNLPANDPVFIHAGQDNGIQPGDDGESDLDVEISGGIGQAAKVDFVIGTPTFLVDGITNSFEYIVDNNLADIVSSSYGDCEGNEGVGGNEFNLQAFEQAAAQGMSVFIASGDNGPAGCDNQNDSWENLGYAAGGEASTPYSVAVGGTGFYGDVASPGTYWSSTNTDFDSALTYIPEYPWNEAKGSTFTGASSGLAGLWSSSGGISAYYLQPAWQRGPGVPTSDPALTQGGNWVTAINFTNGGGSGYTTAPSVTFTGGGCAQEPAATTTISGGSVNSIMINYGTQGGTLANGQGIGCTSAPTVAFGAAPAGGTTATATSVIGPMQNVLPLISGVPHRYTPDLSLNAASDHDATLYCSEGACEYTLSGSTYTLIDAGLVGGTSVAAPSMAGIQSLINQMNGGRQGMPGYVYYSLAAAQNTSACNSSTPPAAGSHCAFQDITLGNTLICGTSSCSTTTGTKIGFQAGVGYDLATGLGSVNAYNLATQWQSVTFNSSNTTLNLSQTTGIAQGGSVTFSGTVAPGSGTGTPTGDVAFILSSGAFGETVNVTTGAWSTPGPFATLSSGAYTASLTNLPAGTYTITARYAGDDNFASSLSAPVSVTVAPGGSTVTITPQQINLLTCTITNGNTFTYGGLIYGQISVAGASGQGVPTGSLTIGLDGNSNFATVPLDPNGNGYIVAGNVGTVSNSCLYDYTLAQMPMISGGTHTITASYAGDGTFNAATATPATITVTPLSVTPTLAAGATVITAGFADQLTATFTTAALTAGTVTPGASGPTGTVTFKDTTTGVTLGTASVVPTVTYVAGSSSAYPSYTYAATAILSTTGITTTGANAITATYSGDTNFSAATSAAVTVTVGTGTATTTTLTSNGNPTTLGGRPTFTATIGVGSGTAPTTGTVTFYDGTAVLGTGTVGTTHTATLRLATTYAFVGGTHNLTAVYGGITADSASTSAVLVETVTKGNGAVQLDSKTVGKASSTYTFAAVFTPSSTSTAYAPVLGVMTFFDGGTAIGTAPLNNVFGSQGGYGLWTATFSTTALSAGTHSITASYTDVNYTSAVSNTQTVFVGGTPTVTWATPAAINYGTALSATQLNATANIPGTFVYSPASGTVLSGGTQTLSVTFAASDYTDFAPQTSTVSLVVNPVGQTISFTTNPPASAAYGSSFTVAATATSGLAVSSTSAGSCSNVGAVYTLTSGTGICSVIANQAGNASYTAAPTVTKSTTASKLASSIAVSSVSPSSEDYGSTAAVAITATLSWTGSGAAPTGAVTISGNGAGSYGATTCGAASGTTITCSATFTPSGTNLPGSYTESAAFAGDSNYSASASTGSNNFTINSATSSMTLTSSPTSSAFGQSVTFTATVTGENGAVKGRTGKNGVKKQVVTGSVTWSANTGCAASTISNGTATCTTSALPVGTDSVTATYAGDANHGGSTGSVSEVVSTASTTTAVTSVIPSSEDYGSTAPVGITATLSWTGSGAAPTGAVTISGSGAGSYGATSCSAASGTTITCSATFTPSGSDLPGTYTESASFGGDGNYAASSSTQSNNFAISGASSSTSVTSSLSPSAFGQSVTFTATVSGENGAVKGRTGKNGVKKQVVTGSVTWSSNTGCSASTIASNGTATCTTSALPVGTDSVVATYAGDANHGGSTGSFSQVVSTASTTTAVSSVSPSSEDYGSTAAAAITATLSWTGSGTAPTGAVTISGNGAGSYGATSCSAASGTTISCSATYTPTGSELPGSYTETASFAGDTNYGSSSGTGAFTISAATSSMTLSSSPTSSAFGQPVTFTATISGENGQVKGRKNGVKKQVVTGSVTWSASTGCAASTIASNGTATCTTSALPVGTDSVTATYAGDANHGGSSASISEAVSTASTTTAVTNVSPSSEDYGSTAPVAITATLSWTGSGAAPTGAVTISGSGNGSYGATSCGAASGTTITCSATYTPSGTDLPGSYTESASFAGDSNYSGSISTATNNFSINTASSTTTVSSTPNPSLYATQVTFTATINGENSQVKSGRNGVKKQVVTGSVTWSANTACGTTSVSSGNPGIATCVTSSATRLPVGTDVVTATYAGDSNHTGSTGTVNQVVNGGVATTISVTSVSPASEDFAADSPVTIKALLSWTGNGVAPKSSNVTIGGDGNGTYGATTCAAKVGDTITCTATYTPSNADVAGSYTETAAFSGDTNYAASNSAQSNNFTINQATSSVAVASSLDPSSFSQSVTFTATISGENGQVKGRKNGAKGQTVTGSVTWSSNTGCPASTISNGTATCTTTTLPTGTDSVVATYAGDANHGGGTGSYSQTVNAASETIVWATPAAITYGTALSSTQLDATVSPAVAGTFVYTPAVGTVLSAGSHTLSVTFTPSDSSYAPATGTVTLQVNAASTTVVWSAPEAITYGTALSATQLNATVTPSAATGTFAYTPASGTVLSAGSQTLSVTFTPSNGNYSSSTGSVTLQVNPAATTVVWSTPAAITYGTALSATQLNATATPSAATGTFAYTPASGTVLSAGSQTLSVTFTPSNGNYSSSTGSVTLQVNPAATTVVWSTPAAITYGTALSSTQLNATVTPSAATGTFAYTPASGTVLSAGSQTLSVTFTPSNSNYASSTGSVLLVVNKAATTVVWSTPAAITYGTALSGTQLNATATPVSAGTFAYTPASGTVLNAGSQPLSVTFTPSNSNYAASTGSVTLVVNQAAQSITFPTPAPASAVYNSTFTVAASATSGLAVTYSAVGSCTDSGAVYTMTSGSGTCSVNANQAGNANYKAATQVSESVVASPASQTITVTTPAPASAVYGSSFTVAATASDGFPVAYGSSGSCTNSGATYTMAASGSAACSVTFNQSGNNNYKAAPQITETTTPVAGTTPTTSFTGAPSSAGYNTSFAVSATTNAGVAATITAAPSKTCTISGTTVTIIAASGTCTMTASWPSTVTYAAATKTQTTTATKATPVVTWPAPAAITYGTPLSSTQLDATANIGGTFAYTPKTGTLETAGQKTLSVTFTPTTTADYNKVTTTVPLTVNQDGTTIAITSTSPNPSNVKAIVTINFAVTQSISTTITPTGRVTVTASTGETCAATLAQGASDCKITFTTHGTRTLTASYPGDNNNAASTSPAFTQTVN